MLVCRPSYNLSGTKLKLAASWVWPVLPLDKMLDDATEEDPVAERQHDGRRRLCHDPQPADQSGSRAHL